MFITHRLLHVVNPRARLALLGVLSIASLLLASCAEMPTGPSIAVMPAPNKPFDVFMQDDQLCRGWAAHSIGLPGHDAAAEKLLASTVTAPTATQCHRRPLHHLRCRLGKGNPES